MHGELFFSNHIFKWTTLFLECFKCPFEARMCSLLKALGHCNFCSIDLKWAAVWHGYQSLLRVFFLITVSSIPIFSVLAPNCTSDNSAHFSYYFWTNKIYVALELKTVLNSQNFGKEHCRKEERDGPAFPLLDSLSCNEGGKTDFWNCIQQLY